MAHDDTLIGQTFEGRYLVDTMMSENEVSTLYRATQIAVRRTVALRIAHPKVLGQPEQAARFEKAAASIASIHHPNIVNLIDFGFAENGQAYLVREFIDGERLYHVIGNHAPLPERRATHILVQVLEALAEAHTRGIVHRDLNPRSIFVQQVGASGDFIKVFDFRVGIPTTARRDLVVSQDPHYMAPEQIHGETLTPKTDLYAFGVVAYEVLSGAPPFVGPDRPTIVAAHIESLATPPRVNGEFISGPLVDVVMQCLAKSPDDRPQSATDILAYLKAQGVVPTSTGAATERLLPAAQPAPARSSDGVSALEKPLRGREVQAHLAADCELPGTSRTEEPFGSYASSTTPWIVALLLVSAIILFSR